MILIFHFYVADLQIWQADWLDERFGLAGSQAAVSARPPEYSESAAPHSDKLKVVHGYGAD